MKLPLITNSASLHIEKLSSKHNKFVRLVIESGGCQGFNKKWEFTDSIVDDDQVIQCGSGKLIIDKFSLEILENSIIDYKVDLSGSQLTIEIPSATSTCGCGTSFSL